MIVEQVIFDITTFGIGFMVGLMLDVVATKIHKKYSNRYLLMALIFLQLFMVFYMIELFNFNSYARIGILTSQVFLFKYAIKQFYNPLAE